MYKVCVTRKRFFWYVQLVSAHNGQVIMTSETYYNKSNARRIARKVAAAGKFTLEEK